MPELQPWTPSAPYPIHKSWETLWATDLQDADLRKAIWADPRFAERIIISLADVSNIAPPAPPAVKVRIVENLIRAASRKDFLRRIGLAWLAPSLAGKLLNTRTRTAYGSLSHDDMTLILENRDHTSPDMVGAVDADMDLQKAGIMCLYTWLAAIPDVYANRIMLLLPRLDDLPLDQPRETLMARIALINRLFADDPR